MSRTRREFPGVACRIGIAAVLIAVCVLPCAAQEEDRPAAVRRIVKEAVRRRVVDSLARTGGASRELYGAQYNQLVHLYALLLLEDSLGARALADAMETRTDTQAGSQAGSGGGTSLVTKGLAPKVFSWAVEHGALDRSVNDSVVTFRGNPSGIVRALHQSDVVDVLLPDRRWWNGVSFAISFDTTRGSNPGTFFANRQQISAWSVRWEVLNRRDPTAAAYTAQWSELAQRVFSPLTTATQRLGEAIDPSVAIPSRTGTTALKGIIEQLIMALKEVDDRFTPTASADELNMLHERAAAIAEPFLRQIQSLDVSRDPFLSAALDAYQNEWIAALDSRAGVQEWIARGVLLTTDWTVARDPQLPDLHTVTGVLEWSPDRARLHDLTINGSVSFYGNGRSAFRDSKVTAQYDIPLRAGAGPGTFVLSLAGRWEHIPDATPISTAVREALTSIPAANGSMGEEITPMIEPGNIGVFQLKLSIPVKGAGIQIPLALTASNRQAQIREKWNVGANFGVTFNFDSFLAAFKAR